jgi:hypothetical protein
VLLLALALFTYRDGRENWMHVQTVAFRSLVQLAVKIHAPKLMMWASGEYEKSYLKDFKSAQENGKIVKLNFRRAEPFDEDLAARAIMDFTRTTRVNFMRVRARSSTNVEIYVPRANAAGLQAFLGTLKVGPNPYE